MRSPVLGRRVEHIVAVRQQPRRHVMGNDVVVRPATPADAVDVASVHVESWRAAYAGIVPQPVLDAMTVESRLERWTAQLSRAVDPVWLAIRRADVVGFARVGASRDEGAHATGELHVLYLRPDVWGTGVAVTLHDAAVAALAERFDAATLWVFEANARARSFYTGRGWRPDGARNLLDIGGEQIPEVRYRRALR